MKEHCPLIICYLEENPALVVQQVQCSCICQQISPGLHFFGIEARILKDKEENQKYSEL